MIAIVSGSPRERTALVLLCEQRGWQAIECHSVDAVRKLLGRLVPRVVVVRSQLPDGSSDDILTAVRPSDRGLASKVIVLLPGSAPAEIDARQLRLGADCVQRDPVRTDVLLAYIEKYRRRNSTARLPLPRARRVCFLDAELDPLERTMTRRGRTIRLTPKESMLAEMLFSSANQVVTYDVLYNEILGRKFRGDTINMRVLFAKLASSIDRIGLSLRSSVHVIPKTGYQYKPFR